MTHTFFVSGMTCDACIKVISLRVRGIPGVREVSVSRDRGVLSLESDSHVTLGDVRSALSGTAYVISE